jgi:hypothetical protein
MAAHRFGACALHATPETPNLTQVVKIAVIACSVIKAATWPPLGLRTCVGTVSVTSTEAEAANACPDTRATCFLQEILGMDCQVISGSAQGGLTLWGVLFPEYHAALAVAGKVAGVR